MRRERKRLRPSSPKDRKKRELRHVVSRFNLWFEEAVSPRLDDLSKEIKEIEQKIQELKQEKDDYPENMRYDTDGKPDESYMNLFAEEGGLAYEIDLLSSQKLAIEEMKVVGLYKDFEIFLKELITISFPDAVTKELYKWENVKSFLKSYSIQVGDIRNQGVINELRIVNNNIKHSNTIEDAVKNIPEFENKEEFDYEGLSQFYDRVRNEPVNFLDSLVDKILAYLFVFDEERIDKIASEYEGRMDKDTAMKFAEALLQKFR